MGHSPYLFRLLRRAQKMTKDDIGFASPRVAILHAVAALTTLVVLYFAIGLDSVLEELNGYWVAVFALVAFAGLVFVWNLILSPWQLQKEADKKITELEKVIDDREAQQRVLNRLWELRSEGISIRNESIRSEAQFTEWQRRYKEWRENILEAAGKRSENLREWLSRLERMQSPPGGLEFFVGEDPVTGMPDYEHKRLASIMTEILVRLQKHLERDLT